MQASRPRLAELGVFLLVVALPLIFTPFPTSPLGDPKLASRPGRFDRHPRHGRARRTARVTSPCSLDGAGAAFTVAAILLSSWLVEPAHPALTPLLFSFMAIAGPVSDDASAGERGRPRASVPLVAAAFLMIATAVTVLDARGGDVERWGRTYGEIWALKGALRIQPWWLSSAERLA